MKLKWFVFLIVCLIGTPAVGEVITSSDTHYVLRHEAISSLTEDELWSRLIKPSSWWHPDHSYSGSAENLSLDARAGGLWREDWEGGSVEHGRVVLVQPKKMLRMVAPFGPLQGVGAYVVWTISITSTDEGTSVRFDETATSLPGSKLNDLAPAVDGVKAEAIKRLTTEK